MTAVSGHGEAHRLSALLAGIADVSGDQDRNIDGLSLDSRQARCGDLFFARGGTRRHGLHYLHDALRAGVAAVAWEPAAGWSELPPPPPGSAAVPTFAVDKLDTQIGVIADRFYGHPSKDLFVVGVTGTDGKTSCTQFLARCLDQPEERCGVIGTLGYGLYGELGEATHTTPDAVRLHRLLADMRERGARCVVMEVSSHALAQSRVAGVAFDVAVLTNLSRDHLDYHGDEAAYARAKRRLFEQPGLGTAVINMDDAFGRTLLAELPQATERVGYGFGPVSDNLRQVVGSELRLDRDGFSMRVATPWGRGTLDSPLLGRFNASNALAVLAVLLLRGQPFAQATAAIRGLATVPGRMERFGGAPGQPLVVVDYAHTPDALRNVLEALRSHCQGRLWCVFGCGGDRDRGKRPLMGAVAERLADRVVVTDDNPRTEAAERIIEEILTGMQAPERVQVERDRERAIVHAVDGAAPEDLVLIAGKGHEEYQLVGERTLPFSDRALVRRLLAGGGQ